MQSKIKKTLLKHDLYNFCELLSINNNFMIFGGYIRDIILGREPNDLDIVVDDQLKLKKFIKNFNYVKNKFNGYRIIYNGWNIDIWALEQSKVKTKTFIDAIHNTFLTCNGIGYIYKENKIIKIKEYNQLKINSRIYMNKNDNWKRYFLKKVNKLKKYYPVDKELEDFLKVENKYQLILNGNIIKKYNNYSDAMKDIRQTMLIKRVKGLYLNKNKILYKCYKDNKEYVLIKVAI